MPVPFPLVTTFETAGTYKKWLWSNSAYIAYTWHALLIWHTYLHTYIYICVCTASARICTPLIVSRSLRSLANYGACATNMAHTQSYSRAMAPALGMCFCFCELLLGKQGMYLKTIVSTISVFIMDMFKSPMRGLNSY